MREITKLADIKKTYATRIRAAISGIRRQVLPCDRPVLDEFRALVTPGCAYDQIGEQRMPIDLRRPRTHRRSKFAVVLHELGKAIQEYWTLLRTDDEVGLNHLCRRLENYAENGFKDCELLGGPGCGYGLFDPRKQT